MARIAWTSLISILFSSPALASYSAVDWAQPPVGCIEEVAPGKKGITSEIYAAMDRHGISPQILLGALMQESNLKNLGISPDGGNYSCGIGQLNVREWCEWANSLDDGKRIAVGWPTGNIACDESNLPSTTTEPFFRWVEKKSSEQDSEARGFDLYQVITFKNLHDDLKKVRAPVITDGTESPPQILVTEEVLKARFLAGSSFTRFCGDERFSIRAKAFALAKLFNEEVPEPLRTRERYENGKKFSRKCQKIQSGVYPLHTGWLMAVAMYNAGKKFLPRVASYYRISSEESGRHEAWAEFDPTHLVAALEGGGVYNPETKELNYLDFNGNPIEASWMKACIAQQHVARVIRFVTRPGFEIARSLTPRGCFQTPPPARREASGFFDSP
ncbi:MAG: hypothetical protein H7301_08885 [Cryobacterium sp.]|nr:hypothetical protein [Oligoflexia bacterium]